MNTQSAQSYTSHKRSLRDRLDAWWLLFRRTCSQSKRIDEHVQQVLARDHQVERGIAEALGRPVVDLKMLEIGVGQLPRQIAYFAQNNDVIGIDLDVTPLGFSIRAYVQMWKRNGPIRVAKTPTHTSTKR